MITLNEYIKRLQDLAQKHGGDLPVIDEDGESVTYPEYDDYEIPAIVVCSKR